MLGLALAFAVFWLADGIITPWLLYSERFAPFWQKRTEDAVAAYQAYVTENSLTVRQVMEDQESRLDAMGNGIYAVMTSPMSSVEIPEDESFHLADSDDVSYVVTWAAPADCSGTNAFGSMEFVMDLHQIQCADGMILVSTAPSAQGYEGLGRVAGLLLALIGFCAVVVPYIVRLLRRISELSREAGVLMTGDLEHAIAVKGRDELSGLGEDIERLRRSVLARLEGEQEAVRANSRLITSLSHDLRTPLTKLRGYLDILIYEKYRSREDHDDFLRLASEKAAQLKALTDQLFSSACVAAPEAGLEQPPEAVDGAALLGQLLSEQCDDLRREGFDVQPPVFGSAFTLYLRTEDAVRIFDNLFSNLKKYADPTFPVSVRVTEEPESVTLTVENRPLPAPDRGDSHGLGLPTMETLMARSGGALEISEEKGMYQSALTFRKCRS